MAAGAVLTGRARPGRGVFARHLLGAGALAASAYVSACLEDLPTPRDCPPAAQFAGADCLPALSSIQHAGCFEDPQMACLSGGRDCTCIADECPEPRESCFPDGDCPPGVRRHAEDAQCHRLMPADFGGGMPSEYLCLCGCAGCAAVCDGKGPVMGVAADGSPHASPVFLVNLDGIMPAEGRLGAYLRVRGLSTAAVVLARFAADGSGELELLGAPVYYMLTGLDTEFVELVLFDDLINDPYGWSRYKDRPVLMAIVPQSDSDQPISTLFEIDCIVPFVAP